MLILSRVCAEFRNKTGRVIFRVTPRNLLSFLEAPEEIREDPLFRMLQNDGSLEAVHSVRQERELANDPTEGMTAEGKKPSPAKAAQKEGAPDQPAPADSDTRFIPVSGVPEAPLPDSSGIADHPAPDADASAKSPAKTRKAAK